MSAASLEADVRIADLPPSARKEFLAGRQSLQRGDAATAVARLQSALRIAGPHAEVLRFLGAAQSRLGRHEAAIAASRQAADRAPRDAPIRNSLGTVLAAAEDYEAAIAEFEHACGLAPDFVAAHANLGRALYAQSDVCGAELALGRASALAPDNLPIRFLWVNCLRANGKTDAAANEYRAILGADPGNAEAWLGLANLNHGAFDRADLEAMRCAADDPRIGSDGRVALGFALARACEDLGEYAQAIAELRAANAEMRRRVSWRAAELTAFVDACLDPRAWPQACAHPDLGAEAIFLVGMPRSGSSLIEQILASHAGVEGGGELDDLRAILHAESLRRSRPYPGWLASATREDWQRLGETYLSRTARRRRLRPRFTDKLLDNWRFLGALSAMLPGARVIACARDPLETCFAAYRQLFADLGQPFSYDLADLAAYAGDHARAIAHARNLCPDRLRVQSYEALIENPEAEIRALLEFCGLPFDPACLRFYETERSVRTASAAQVRQPLRRRSVRTENYGALLDPLRSALGLMPFPAFDADLRG